MRHHDLAVEHELFCGKRFRACHHVGEIARQRFAGLGLQLDRVAVAKDEATEAVPFRLILPLRPDRNGIDRGGFHRGDRRLERHGLPAHTSLNANGQPSAGHRKQNFAKCQAAADVIHCSSFCFGAAPTWREASSPFLHRINVGIDMMPYLAAVAGFSSTLSFTILTLPPIVPESSSSAGAIILQGPHHSAQKSTTTGSVLLSTCASKSASETFATPMRYLGCLEAFESRANALWMAGTYGRR